jgi:formamidopyrimidine-DNA glycosylase
MPEAHRPCRCQHKNVSIYPVLFSSSYAKIAEPFDGIEFAYFIGQTRNQKLPMPELPDLQVFAANLHKKLRGKKIARIKIVKKTRIKTSEKVFNAKLKDATVNKIYREGKEIHISFTNGNVVGLHMMLHGKLYLFEEKNEEKYTIAEFYFEDGTGLALTDFQGMAVPTLNPEIKEAPDALSKTITAKWLASTLATKKTTIKNFLLDQNSIRGIGNAYADEVLYEAGISPFSVAGKIPPDKLKGLATSIKRVLTKAEKQIRKKEPGIIAGEVRDFLNIHNAEKTKSPGGKKIQFKMAGGRKTYYTAEQKLYD